jgi:hypothetical protein
MVRDPYEEEAGVEGVEDCEEEMGEIPIPSCSIMEMGVTVAINESEEVKEEV